MKDCDFGCLVLCLIACAIVFGTPTMLVTNGCTRGEIERQAVGAGAGSYDKDGNFYWLTKKEAEDAPARRKSD